MYSSSEFIREYGLLLLLGATACTVVYLAWDLSLKQKRQAELEVKGHSTEPVIIPEKHSYAHVFPPSQRTRLAALGPQYADVSFVDLATVPKNRILDSRCDYRQSDPSLFIYSGFSIGDIRSLGRLPDYATLSGVPLPSPLLGFDPDRAKPRPYRPFRWAYHQTMSLSKMDPDFWIELESTYRQRIAERHDLFANHGKHVLDALPGSELACRELMEMVVQFLCARYPSHFELDGCVLLNRILNIKTNVSTEDPLPVLLQHVPEDFGIMIRDPDTGRYVLRAGVICSTLGWKLSEKMGMGLADIHKVVPDYKEKLEFSMDRFFTQMPTNKPIQRGSWGLEAGQPLYLPADHADFAHRSSQDPKLKVEDIHLRVDWQTLRRLPLSGAVIFNFKALFTPLAEFADEPCIPSLVLKVLDEGKRNIMEYKGTWHVEHVARPALEQYARLQVETGMMEADWCSQTLPEAPFFKGWERKWSICQNQVLP